MKSSKQTFETIPAWCIDGRKADRCTVAAAFRLAGLAGRWVRLTAATQRAVFGHNLFGKCQVRVDEAGVKVVRSVCFGQDFSEVTLEWSDLERCMATGRGPVL